MKRINAHTFALTVLILSATATFAQTSIEQNIKAKFKKYISPRLDGRTLKTVIFQGDINGDNKIDYLIDYCVQATDRDRDVGGGNALMNLVCMEEGIAIYLRQGNDYVLSANKSKESFKSFEDISFDIKRIENKIIICESTGYKDNDARCCPTLKRNVYLKLSNGKLEKTTSRPTTDNQIQDKIWTGTYTYEIQGTVSYSLTIKPNNFCIYEAVGVQTFCKVSCRGVLNGGKFEVYWVKNLEGAFYPSDWIDKSKPIMTLFYKNGKLYTDEGQLNSEIKGGQLLFKKTK